MLDAKCRACHQDSNRSGGFSISTPEGLLKAIEPGNADGSLLVKVISGVRPRMPKAGAALSAAEVAQVRAWVEQGAAVDGETKAPWWSLRPLRKREGAPDIDAYVGRGLAAKGLTPSPEADRRTLLRRLYYDLHGLPPSPEAIAAFESDRSPEAYERVVDQLLASPRYGERWARHWLDVVHYGDSHGYDKDKPRENAWPYRDWVIAALNGDMAYGRFVESQIAGDVLFQDEPTALVATGFLAAGPWDFVGHQELKEGTTDKNLTRLLDRDDVVAATMSTFTSMTVHCARCHDHKFDPIPQRDYYSLQAVFAGVDRADRPWDEDPALMRRRAAVLERKRAAMLELQPLLDKVEFATSPELVELDDRIRDGKLLMTHMGQPKTAAEEAEKKRLQARVERDQEQRKALLDALVGAETYAAISRAKVRVAAVDGELEALPKPRMVYAGTSLFTRVGNFRPALEPRPVTIPGRDGEISPHALSCVKGAQWRLPENVEGEGARRAALARWITDKENMLTWRSIVNRVWHYHFGAGIVDTPNDFGRMGSQPTHPELLDHLAVWFRDEAGGSLKKLHKRIAMSAAYRQSSAHRAEAAAIDGDNRLLWRMNRGRLDAESVRDSVLAIAGKLDLTMGGPGARMFFFKNDHSPVYDYARFDPDSEGGYRRSIYRFIVRSVPDPFLERLDCPDPSLLAPKRTVTLTAIQALALWNNPFMIRMSEHLAERVAGAGADGQVSAMVRLVLGRAPSAEESGRLRAYAERHGAANLARLLFNTNEFLFVD
ncbi:MAG: PSD1 and planctomycete cytochrome C domain-containing protein [Bryobacteraceae bacterium]